MTKHSDAVKEEARKRRLDGQSVNRIAREMGLGQGTVSLWMRDVVLPNDMVKEMKGRGGKSLSQKRREYINSLGIVAKTAMVKSGDYNPKQIGEKTEAQILARFLMADLIVLHPYGDNQRYDLVVDESGKFIRVQCKTARYKGGRFVFSAQSTNWNSGKRRDYRGQCDVFAVFLRENEKVYIFNTDKCPTRECSVWIGGNRKDARMASNHEFVSGKSLMDYP